ncbi:uncharacterized protein LOC124168781 isoform X2 [Ischnura elegans]|nr:uncharacterized protein LOC124168781 isoform X2 [Ischnura elegans]
MRASTVFAALLLACGTLCLVGGQRITTIQLDGVQYFVSRMNPYSPALNYFLAYQYCRSLGLQLASFETKEKADSITQYLTNAGYSGYDFWTSGNRLGRDMFLWMSTGLPFNVTFNYMRESNDDVPPTLIGSGPVAEEEGIHDDKAVRGRQLASKDGACVMLSAPDLKWDVDDCNVDKDFICEQTRCYYYNYGSIPVSASQG